MRPAIGPLTLMCSGRLRWSPQSSSRTVFRPNGFRFRLDRVSLDAVARSQRSIEAANLVPARQCFCRIFEAAAIWFCRAWSDFPKVQLMMILVCGPIRRNSRSIEDFVIETQPAVGAKIAARQMQEHRAAAAGDARRGVVIDLDDEIVEMIIARQPVAALTAAEPHRLVVMTVMRVFAPGVFGPDRRGPAGTSGAADGGRRATTIAAGGRCPGRPAVAFALVGKDACRGRAPPARPMPPAVSQPRRGHPRRDASRIAESGRSRTAV